MGQNNLIDKLSLQVESFQDGFLLLSKSAGLREMSQNFARILKDNFLLKNVYLLKKISADSEWENLEPASASGIDLNGFFTNPVNQKINYFPDKEIVASISIPLDDKTFIGMLLGKKLDGTDFNDYDKITLQVLLQVFYSAHRTYLTQMKEKNLVFELNEKILQLNNLIDTGIELSKFEKRDILYELAMERACSITNASSALIKVQSDSGDVYYSSFPHGIDPEIIETSKFKVDTSFRQGKKVYTFILYGKETRSGITSFNELDKLLLQSISRQMSASIENEFLLQQSLEKERIEQELAVAASIQQTIIPKVLPEIKGYEMAGINIPSKEVGGDYFDTISMDNERTAFIIADVTGKGISAALLVNTLHAALYSYLEFNLPLTDLSDKLNKIIYKSSPSDKFITFFICVLNHASGELDILNAGHNPVLLLRKNSTIEKLNAGGVGLGMFDFGIPFLGQTLTMESGDTLFLYTDGIPEAMNEIEEEYSDERMISLFTENASLPANEFINLIVKDVRDHVGTAQQSDDITALILKKE